MMQRPVPLNDYQRSEDVPAKYQQRDCTDIFCIIIGVLFSLTIILISVIGYSGYHFVQSNFPADSDGSLCGIDLPGYNYVYFAQPPQIAKRVCVSQCPKPGDTKLKCSPTSSVGCRFSSAPGFEVQLYENQPAETRNGMYCFPTDQEVKIKLEQNSNLLHRNNFMRSLDVIFICMAIALGASIVYMLMVQFLPQAMNRAAVIAGVVAMVILLICCLFYPTIYTTQKWICFALLFFLIIIIAVEVLFNRKSWRVHGIFLKEATNMAAARLHVFGYIPLFLGIAVVFTIILIYQFKSIWTQGGMQFDAEKSLFYELKGFWPNFMTVLWAIQAIWGLTFIKESFNFCVSTTAVQWYYDQNVKEFEWTEGYFYPLKLLVMKHFGSVIGGSFMTGFFSLGDYISDFFKPNYEQNPNGCYTKFYYSACVGCLKVFELVRSDAMAFIGLAGNPFCNSSRYCEYLCDHSLLMDNSQSTSRSYRICAHFLIAAFISILGLYLKGLGISLYTIAIIIILTIFISTFFISVHADAAQAIQIIFLENQQFNKRNGLKQDKRFNPNNLQSAFHVQKRQQLADELKDMRKSQMQIEAKAARQ